MRSGQTAATIAHACAYLESLLVPSEYFSDAPALSGWFLEGSIGLLIRSSKDEAKQISRFQQSGL